MDGCSLLLRLLVVKQINKAARKEAHYHKQHPVRRSGPLSDDIEGKGERPDPLDQWPATLKGAPYCTLWQRDKCLCLIMNPCHLLAPYWSCSDAFPIDTATDREDGCPSLNQELFSAETL